MCRMWLMTAVEQLYASALELSPEERAQLANLLLDTAEVEPGEDWWASIEPEVERVEAAIQSGEMKTIPWEEVRRRVAERLSRDRG